jgi:hypothetical protein
MRRRIVLVGYKCAAQLECIGDPLDSEHVCARAHIHFVLAAEGPNVFEATHHDAFKALSYGVQAPAVMVQILDPLEVRHDDAACVS